MLRVTPTAKVLCLLALITLVYFFIFGWNLKKPELLFTNDEKYFNATLTKLLKPRYLGSSGHSEVKEFLLKELNDLGFTTIRDKQFNKTALENVVGVMNMKANNLIMLCCHYDSKFIKDEEIYVGATDGAVSCAILLNMAKALAPYLHKVENKHLDIGLLLVFFDGHESFADVLTDSNSLNGSRHFVEVETIPLYKIDVTIALNLIGAPNHIYLNHFENTKHLHNLLVNIELELNAAGKLERCHKLFYAHQNFDNDIEDDHYPFMEEDVPVMHIVPHSYPDVWHSAADNLENLHWPTMRNMIAIVTRFVYEYINKSEKFMITTN